MDAQGPPLHKLGVYFPLSDMNETNGSTSLWPGSHLTGVPSDEEDGGAFEPDGKHRAIVEERRRIAPPVQLAVPEKAVIFRDLRLWHLGTVNRTQRPRHLISLHLNATSDPHADSSHLGPGIVPHTFSEDCRAAFRRPTSATGTGRELVDWNVRFTEERLVDHFGNSSKPEPHQLAFRSGDLDNDAGSNASATTAVASFNARFEMWLPSGPVTQVEGADAAAYRWTRLEDPDRPQAAAGSAPARL